MEKGQNRESDENNIYFFKYFCCFESNNPEKG